MFGLLLKPQIADHEVQERTVRGSGLDWTLVQPVYLTDGEEPASLSTDGSVEGMQVSRRAVGDVLAHLATEGGEIVRSVSVSGAVSVLARPDRRTCPLASSARHPGGGLRVGPCVR